MILKKYWIASLLVGFATLSFGQSTALPPLKKYLSKDSTTYIQGTILGQFWGRYTQQNPGSAFNNEPINNTLDLGIRRIRFSAMAEVKSRFFFYTQFGLNNLSTYNARKQGLFVHDAIFEAKVYKNYLVIGGGLNGWNGTTRYSSSSVNSILGLDLPVWQETTNDITDQFGRKFGIYAKGKIKKFDYRIAVAQPFSTKTASAAVDKLNQVQIDRAVFSEKNPKLNYAGYFQYQIFDQESNQMPYNRGSYLGQKRILNVGTGFQYQKDAMWYRNNQLDTISTPLFQYGLDVFFDYAFNKEKQNALTVYAAYTYFDFGPNYIRNSGVMNIANSSVGHTSFNGVGNGTPLIGTGSVGYIQAAYKFKNNLLGPKCGTLQPYAIYTLGDYKMLNNLVHVYNVGVNWLIMDQNIKLSLDYQSRPIFDWKDGAVSSIPSARRGQFILQLQFSI